MAHLITASSGTPHITPKSDASWHRGVMGVENCILDFGEKLAPMLVPSQPTNIRILDGVGMFQGRFFEIESGSYDTIAIPNGAQGYSRIDLVCAKITQNGNGTQTFSWEVVQGTQTEGTPTPPEVEEGSLDDGDEYALMPIASVELEGVNIVAVETVAEIGKTVDDAIKGVVDYVVEEGTDGDWTYRKWNSGISEFWFAIDAIYTIGTARGDWYSSADVTRDFPTGLFVNIPTMVFGQGLGTVAYVMFVQCTGIGNSWYKYRIVSNTSAAAATHHVSGYAIGKWK